MLLSSNKHLTAKRRNVTSMTSLDIFALLSLFISLVFWGQVAHEHFGNTTWMGHEIALLARGGRHFLVLTTEGSTPPHPINVLCNDKELNIVCCQLTIKLNPTIYWNTPKWLTILFLSNKILSRWKLWILKWTNKLIVLDILTLVHFVLFANLNGLLHLQI